MKFRTWLIYRVYYRIRMLLKEYYERMNERLEKPRQKLIFYLFMKYRVSKIEKSSSENQPRILFGPCPIINNKYWSRALKSKGYISDSMTTMVPKINRKEDFDFHANDIYPISKDPTVLERTKQRLAVFEYALKNYDLFVMAFRFTFLDGLPFEDKEYEIIKRLNKKVMIIPYGSDYYKYSKVIDASVKHNLMLNFPSEIYNEDKIINKVKYWVKNADFIQMGTMIDDASRWDILPVSSLCVELNRWKRNKPQNNADGVSEEVYIVHSPNHRGFKGTEFIIDAIEQLKFEGLKIKFILLENVPNEKVREILTEQSDILIEQIIFTGYGMNGMEGMASGNAVIANLDNKEITTIFRRYSYLNECPILSSSPENIKDNLRLLITNPVLRNQLGDACRKYVEKYNSTEAITAFFEQFIRKCWYGDPSVDSMNFFHPLRKESYNNSLPKIEHPLVENRYTVKSISAE